MNVKGKSPYLTIDESADGSVAVSGAVPEGDEQSLQTAVEAVWQAKHGVVIILRQAETDEPVAVPSTGTDEDSATPGALEAIASAVTRALDQKESLSQLIEQLTPKAISSPPALLQARRNAQARLALLEEFGILTAAEVSELAGSEASNRSALATRWRKEGRIFAVPQHGGLYYPLFQFGEDGRPLPVVAEILTTFRGVGMGDWETALWFTGGNGWIDDRRPVDILCEDPEAVVRAASHETDEIAG